MRVGIYARVSTTDKDQNPETQLLPLREFCAAQGWTVAGEFVDHASATDVRNRRAWTRLLDLAGKRTLDVILVWKMDRCFRSTMHALTILEQLRGWKVGLRSYSEPWLDTSGQSAAGTLMMTILAAFAEFERSLIAERVRAGMARAKKQGVHLGRPPAVNGEWPDYRRRLLAGEITQADAARALGISRSTVCRLLQKGSPKTAPPARA